jgi:hypothetical protein
MSNSTEETVIVRDRDGARQPTADAWMSMTLVEDLNDTDVSHDQIELLNNAFDAYRAADDDQVLSAASTTQLVEALEQIASAQPHLTAKAADLQSQLDERRRQQADSDFPF